MRPTIGLLINNFDNEYQGAVLAGVQSVCVRRDVNLLGLSGGLRNTSDWDEPQRNSFFQRLLPSSFDRLLVVSGLVSGHLGLEALVHSIRSVIGTVPWSTWAAPTPGSPRSTPRVPLRSSTT